MVRLHQARDILQRAEQFHNEVSNRYRQFSDASDKARLRLLLDYLGDRQTTFAGALERVSADTSRNVTDTWFQFAGNAERLNWPACDLPPQVTTENIIDVGMKVADCFIRLYREIADQADSEDVRRIFRDLLESEEREKRELVRNAQLLEDL